MIAIAATPITEVSMPHHWTKIGTPDDLRAHLDEHEYEHFKREVARRVSDAGLALDEVFFEGEDGPAWVLVHVPGEVSSSARQTEEALGSSQTVVLYTVEELRHTAAS